jgi:hypothetical protein
MPHLMNVRWTNKYFYFAVSIKSLLTCIMFSIKYFPVYVAFKHFKLIFFPSNTYCCSQDCTETD